jgi:NADH-quinone oxidoreductase subunit J
MDLSQILFLVVAAITLMSAIAVVTFRNLIHAALMLIATLFSIAILFVLLDAGFMAAVQVVLYIGAIAILIIFAMMLTRRVMADEQIQTNTQWLLGGLVSLAILVGLVALVWNANWPAWSNVDTSTSIAELGRQLTNPDGFVLPFQIASVLLTVALVGAIAVAGEKK